MLAFLALLVGQFVYYQNTILAFTFWLILGLSVVNWQKPVKEKIISFKDFPELSLVFSAILIVLGLAILGAYFFAGKFYLADTYYRKAVGTDRIERLEKATKLNPYQSQYKIVLSRAYLNEILTEMQKPAESRDQTAISLNVHRAITYNKGGQIGQTYVKGATELSPNRVAAWETLGMIYRDIRGIATGALEWGIKSFEKAIALEPVNPVLHTELGKLYLISNEKDKGRAEFEKAIELKSNYIDASIQLALMYEGENNLDEAVKQMEDLANSYPFNVEVLFQLGRLYFNNNQTDEAITQFERVINLMPNHSNAHYSLGVAYQKKGEREKAIKEFEKVLELNPGNQDIQQKLQELKGE
jgi:tetratricopeptide (TPR) repeat protein